MLPLNFQTIARSRGESVRPDLWADYLVAPMLGYDSAPRDIINHTSMSVTGSISWAIDRYIMVQTTGSGYSGLYDSFALNGWPLTIVVLAQITTVTAGQYGCYVALNNDASNTNSVGLVVIGGKINGFVYSGAWNACAGATTLSINNWYSLAFRINSDTDRRVFVNGASDGIDTDTDAAPTGITNISLGYLKRLSPTDYSRTNLSMLGVYKKSLTDQQILALTADPLLPLRRKKIWSMYVPSTPSGVVLPVFMNHYRNQRIA